MNLHPVRSASVPVRKKNFIAIRSSSGAPYRRRNARRTPKKMMKKKLRKEEEQQKRKDHRLAEKLAKMAKRSVQKVQKQAILMHVAFFVIKHFLKPT